MILFLKDFNLFSKLKIFNNFFYSKIQNLDFTCDVCGQKFTEKSYWDLHRKKHNLVRDKFKCGQCEKEFLYQSSLRTHIKYNSLS